MKITLKDLDANQEKVLDGVEKIFLINENFTQCDALKNSILIIHKINHSEKYRLFKNARLISIEN